MFQNKRNKTEKRVMEISNFLHKVWHVELSVNQISTSQDFLMKTMVIANNVVVSSLFLSLFQPIFQLVFIHIVLFFFLLFLFHNSRKTKVLFNIILEIFFFSTAMLVNIFPAVLNNYLYKVFITQSCLKLHKIQVLSSLKFVEL